MNTKILFLTLVLLFNSIAAYAQLGSFYNLNLDLNIPEKFNSVFFINQDTGWIAGSYGLLLNTTDGGCNWERKELGIENDINRIVFKNPQFGWLHTSDTLYYTTDGGIVWREKNVGNFLTSVYIKDTMNIWVGRAGFFTRTNNGGQTWSLITYWDIYDLHFFDDLNVWAIGEYFAKSTDGGITFSAVGPTEIFDGYFDNANRIWGVGYYGNISKVTTPNFAVTQQISNTTNTLLSIDFSQDLSVGYCAGKNATILYSTNQGNLWNPLSYSFPTDFYSVDVIDSSRVWITGEEVILTNHTGVFDFLLEDTTVLVGTELQIICKALAIPAAKYYLEEYPANMTINNVSGLINWTPDQSGSFSAVVRAENNFGFKKDTLNIFVSPLSSVTDELFLSGFKLSNFPNPFNPKTTINFEIPVSTDVSIIIFDMLGNELATILENQMSAGQYSVQWDASNFPSGTYLCLLKTKNISKQQKLLLLK